MATDKAKPLITIDIVSDVMCPWCWVGKKKLDKAVSDLDDRFTFKVRWEPYLLRPSIPPEGADRETLPSPDNPRVQQVIQACKEVGIDLNFKKDDRRKMPYTLYAHQLLDYAGKQDGGVKQNEVSELLFKSFFTEGSNLTKEDVLKVAKSAGFNVKDVEEILKNTEHAAAIKKKAVSWSMEGIHGVPYFIMNGKPSVSGAQDVETFKKTILRVAEKFPLETSSKV